MKSSPLRNLLRRHCHENVELEHVAETMVNSPANGAASNWLGDGYFLTIEVQRSVRTLLGEAS